MEAERETRTRPPALDWLEHLSGQVVNPAAGSAAALAGAMGVALLCRSVQLEAQPLLESGHSPTVPDGHAGMRLIEASQEILCDLVRADLRIATDPALVKAVEQRLEGLTGSEPETATDWKPADR